jgi:NAD(P)-dependent dehydrogenase (short-subunit alcohol dehydrogenase family)
VITFLPEEERDANETRDAIEAEGCRALLLTGDIIDSHYCEECVEKTFNELGSLDILVNSAAYQKNMKSIEDIDYEQARSHFPHEFLRILLPHKGSGPANEEGILHHQP